MAVGLNLSRKDTGECVELVPVATMQTFRDYWKPGCEELNLQIVPCFDDGIYGGEVRDLTRQELLVAVDELGALGEWFEAKHPPPNGRALRERATRVLRVLERVLNDPNLTIG